MNIQTLISDVDTLCDDEAASGSSGYLSNVRYVLMQLASYVARREQAIDARTAGMVDTALGIETRADAQIAQIVTDGEAMTRPVQPVTESKRRLPTLADAPRRETCDPCGGLGQVPVDPCNGQAVGLETCGVCEGDGFRILDEQDESA